MVQHIDSTHTEDVHARCAHGDAVVESDIYTYTHVRMHVYVHLHLICMCTTLA